MSKIWICPSPFQVQNLLLLGGRKTAREENTGGPQSSDLACPFFINYKIREIQRSVATVPYEAGAVAALCSRC